MSVFLQDYMPSSPELGGDASPLNRNFTGGEDLSPKPTFLWHEPEISALRVLVCQQDYTEMKALWTNSSQKCMWKAESTMCLSVILFCHCQTTPQALKWEYKQKHTWQHFTSKARRKGPCPWTHRYHSDEGDNKSRAASYHMMIILLIRALGQHIKVPEISGGVPSLPIRSRFDFEITITKLERETRRCGWQRSHQPQCI